MGYRGRNRYKNTRTFLSEGGIIVKNAKDTLSEEALSKGQWFDSNWECECWLNLCDLQEESHIYDLSRHKDECQFYFDHNEVRIAKAKLDFSFSMESIERRVIADAKSPATIDFQRFRWQKNMMLAFYDLPVVVFLQGEDSVWQKVMDIKERGLDDYLKPEQVR